MAKIVIDSGFLIALFDSRDNYHQEAKIILAKLEDLKKKQLMRNLVVLWPVIYEVVNTKLVRNSANFKRFLDFLNSFREVIEFTDDSKYREEALNNIENGKRVSFTDHVIQLFLSEKKGIVDYFITFNYRDFPQEYWFKNYGIRIVYSIQDFSWSSYV